MIYDLIIIGAGPAVSRHAIMLQEKPLKTDGYFKRYRRTSDKNIDRRKLLGLPGDNGRRTDQKLENHLHEFKFDLKRTRGREHQQTTASSNSDQTETAQSKALVIATGAKPKYLDIKGVEGIKNKGVSYCTTWRRSVVRRKDVAVIGGGNSALESVLQLANIAKKVYLIIRNKNIDGRPGFYWTN